MPLTLPPPLPTREDGLARRLDDIAARLRRVVVVRAGSWLVILSLLFLGGLAVLDSRYQLPALVRALGLVAYLVAVPVLVRRWVVRPLAGSGDRQAANESAARLAEGQELGADVELRRGELVGPLEDAIFDDRTATGAIAGPLLVDDRWHVARLEGTISASVVPYEVARPSIEAELLIAARRRAFDEWLEQRRQALAVIEPDFEHPAHPMHGVPSHRH